MVSAPSVSAGGTSVTGAATAGEADGVRAAAVDKPVVAGGVAVSTAALVRATTLVVLNSTCDAAVVTGAQVPHRMGHSVRIDAPTSMSLHLSAYSRVQSRGSVLPLHDNCELAVVVDAVARVVVAVVVVVIDGVDVVRVVVVLVVGVVVVVEVPPYLRADVVAVVVVVENVVVVIVAVVVVITVVVVVVVFVVVNVVVGQRPSPRRQSGTSAWVGQGWPIPAGSRVTVMVRSPPSSHAAVHRLNA